jgi:excisionase family DNA binding protein
MAGVREKLLTASDLATLCEVDLKTIHNWVDRGRIAHFRTPGRHLRFRAADVAEFLRAWGYSVPRELAKASSRTVMVIGPKETVAHVSRALGEGGTPAPLPSGSLAPAPVKAGAACGEQGAPRYPIHHVAHPYDALVFAGSDPADVYVVDVPAVAPDIDVVAMLEALHRASPQASFVALSDEAMAVPPFVTRVALADAAALRSLLLSESPGASSPVSSTAAKQAAAGSSMGKASPTPIVSPQALGHDEEEAPPRGLAVGGSSR